MSTKRAVLIVLSWSRTHLHFMLNKLPRIKPALSLLEGQLPIVNISAIPTPNAFEFLLWEQACEAVLYCNLDKTELDKLNSLDKLNIPQLWHFSWTPESREYSSHSTEVVVYCSSIVLLSFNWKALGVGTSLKQLLIVDKHLVLACPYMC